MKKKPKIHIEIRTVNEEVEYRLHRQWNKVKFSEPFLITGDLGEMVESYGMACKKYNIQPDMKLISKIVNKYNNKENKLQHYEKSIFKSH